MTMSRGTRSFLPGSLPGKTKWSLVLALILLLVAVAGCEDLTSAPSVASSAAGTATSTTAPLDMTQPSTDSAADATTTDSTAAPINTATADEPPDVLLTEDDFGREVRLHVGERVRVDLPAKSAEKVVAVEWKYEPVIVQQTDIGTTEASGFVTACWLELEAIAEGRVTVRTVYERSNGTTRTLWVIYLQVLE